MGDPFILSPVATGARPFVPDTLTDYYKRTAKQLGIATHFHELRHFAATTAIGAGTDVRTVAGRLGHTDASVTLRVYAHALEARGPRYGPGTQLCGPGYICAVFLKDRPRREPWEQLLGRRPRRAIRSGPPRDDWWSSI